MASFRERGAAGIYRHNPGKITVLRRQVLPGAEAVHKNAGKHYRTKPVVI